MADFQLQTLVEDSFNLKAGNIHFDPTCQREHSLNPKSSIDGSAPPSNEPSKEFGDVYCENIRSERNSAALPLLGRNFEEEKTELPLPESHVLNGNDFLSQMVQEGAADVVLQRPVGGTGLSGSGSRRLPPSLRRKVVPSPISDVTSTAGEVEAYINNFSFGDVENELSNSVSAMSITGPHDKVDSHMSMGSTCSTRTRLRARSDSWPKEEEKPSSGLSLSISSCGIEIPESISPLERSKSMPELKEEDTPVGSNSSTPITSSFMPAPMPGFSSAPCVAQAFLSPFQHVGDGNKTCLVSGKKVPNNKPVSPRKARNTKSKDVRSRKPKVAPSAQKRAADRALPFPVRVNIPGLRTIDVLCERGTAANIHCGNIAYWKLIMALRPKYISKQVTNQEKQSIANWVRKQVKGNFMGRSSGYLMSKDIKFVMSKIKKAFTDGKTPLWYQEASDEEKKEYDVELAAILRSYELGNAETIPSIPR